MLIIRIALKNAGGKDFYLIENLSLRGGKRRGNPDDNIIPMIEIAAPPPAADGSQ
jgi:hypothetical protein